MQSVTIIVGSDSDVLKVEESRMLEVLDEAEVSWTLSVISTHRNPDELNTHCSKQWKQGSRIFVGVAGMAAALPGVITSFLIGNYQM